MAEQEECEPCQITVAAGMLIKDFCKADCMGITEEFLKGKATIRQLAKQLNASPEKVEALQSQGLNLDMTLEESVKKFKKPERSG